MYILFCYRSHISLHVYHTPVVTRLEKAKGNPFLIHFIHWTDKINRIIMVIIHEFRDYYLLIWLPEMITLYFFPKSFAFNAMMIKWSFICAAYYSNRFIIALIIRGNFCMNHFIFRIFMIHFIVTIVDLKNQSSLTFTQRPWVLNIRA